MLISSVTGRMPKIKNRIDIWNYTCIISVSSKQNHLETGQTKTFGYAERPRRTSFLFIWKTVNVAAAVKCGRRENHYEKENVWNEINGSGSGCLIGEMCIRDRLWIYLCRMWRGGCVSQGNRVYEGERHSTGWRSSRFYLPADREKLCVFPDP